MKHINSWQDIDWDILEYQIFRLQFRIFKAAENRELNKVHKLQTCLISSHSARYLSIRKIIFDNSFNISSSIELIFSLKSSSSLFFIIWQVPLQINNE